MIKKGGRIHSTVMLKNITKGGKGSIGLILGEKKKGAAPLYKNGRTGSLGKRREEGKGKGHLISGGKGEKEGSRLLTGRKESEI